MPEQRKPPPITRTEVIIVDDTSLNDYGDLIVIDKAKIEHKIGKKRERLFNLFQPNASILLKYSVYMDKEYIADAEQVKGNLPVKATTAAVPQVTPPKQVEIKWEYKLRTDDSFMPRKFNDPEGIIKIGQGRIE